MNKHDALVSSIKKLLEDAFGSDICVFLRKYKETDKSATNHKLDYGLGEAGITPNSSDDIKQFYKDHGYTGELKKSNKTIGHDFKAEVGRIVDDYLALDDRKDRYLGACAYSGYVSEFRKLTQKEFIEIMNRNASTISPFRQSTSQKKEWKNEFSLLKKIFKNREFDNLYILFEYVLPDFSYKTESEFLSQLGVRGDVILLKKTAALVIEFKDRKATSSYIDKAISQAKKYVRKLEKYHSRSQSLQHIGVSCCFLQEEKYKKTIDEVICCSSDKLESAIVGAMGKKHKKYPDPNEWEKTEYINWQKK